MIYDRYIQNQKRVRRSIAEAKWSTQTEENTKRDEAIDYFDGRGTSDYLREKYADRYAYGLFQERAEGGLLVKRYRRGLAPDAVGAGMYQIVETRTAHRIVRSLATLFTQPDARWRYVIDSVDQDTGQAEEEDAEDAAEIIQANRLAGGFSQAAIRTDRVSCLLSSSALRVRYHAGRLKYDGGVPPQSIWCVFPEWIIDGDQERAPDMSDIEDAERVIIQLEDAACSTTTTSDSQYLAFFGRSESWPHGRMVTYMAREPYAVPLFGAAGAVDYMIGEEPCNPLTALQDGLAGHADGFAICPHEYPIVMLYGQDVPRDRVVPETSFTLFDNSVELDLQLSRIMYAADRAAVGSVGVKNPEGAELPANPGEGTFELRGAQEVVLSALPSSGPRDGVEVLKAAQLQLATGYSVPGFEIVYEGATAESGAALYVRAQPKLDARRERIAETATSMQRLFEIERGLLAWFGTDEQQISEDVRQHWDPGSWSPPRGEQERVEVAVAKHAANAIDYVDLVAEVHGLTRADAKDLIDSWREDAAEYAAPKAETRSAFGSTRLPPRAPQ